MTDALGLSRDLLYGANNVPLAHSRVTDMLQHQMQHPPPPYGQQSQLYMTNANNVNNGQATQTNRQVNMQFVNTDHCNGQTDQTYSPQSAAYARPDMQHTVQTANGPGADSHIPAWASGLCQQINNLQTLFGGHAERWQVLENNIVIQNETLTSMGKQLAEISSLKREVINTNTRVYDVENTVKNLQTQMKDYDESINSYSNMYDEFTTKSSDTNKKLKNMETRFRNMEQKIDNIDKNIQETNERLTDVRWRSMRENLLFFGIRESDIPGENCKITIKDFLRDSMAIQKDVSFDRVHRLGRYNRKNVRPRPIVAKFTFYKDRELVRLTAPQALGGTRFGVSEQYPTEIEEKRKPLYEVARKAREIESNKVRLVRDKLYINDKLYDPGQTRNSANYTDTREYERGDNRSGQTRNSTNYTDTRAYGRSDTRSGQTRNNTHYTDTGAYERSDNRSTYTNARRYRNSETYDYTQGRNSTRSTRVFYA